MRIDNFSKIYLMNEYNNGPSFRTESEGNIMDSYLTIILFVWFFRHMDMDYYPPIQTFSMIRSE